MAAPSGQCTAPNSIEISQPAAGQIKITWGGLCDFYKLAWKREEDLAYVGTLTMDGPGGDTGGSGYETDDTGPDGVIGPAVGHAEFLLTGLSVGIYDLMCFNKCSDGSDYGILKKHLLTVDVGVIPGIALLEKNNGLISIEWGTPTMDNGANLLVTWCLLNEYGDKEDCDNMLVANAARAYKIPVEQAGTYKISVSQQHNQWQSAYSDELIVVVCEEDCSSVDASEYPEPPLITTTTTIEPVTTTTTTVEIET